MRLSLGKINGGIDVGNPPKQHIVEPPQAQKYSVIIRNAEEYKNERASYAYNISNQNKDFVLTIHAENGAWDETRKSSISYYIQNKKHYDIGICQFSTYYYKHIVEDARFSDWKWQIEQCWDIFQKRPSAFYGYYNRKKMLKFIKFLD